MLASASAPPSSGTPGIWRRKSSTGAVDAQGLGLTHPMTWIDERLFGWSRSARRGTSVWGGHDETSRVGTPDYSDDEDAGDYDNVIGYLPTAGDVSALGNKSRSRANSYANLQKLRQAAPLHAATSLPVTASPESPPIDGIHFRNGPRNRRPSLTNNVPVDVLAEMDQTQTFVSATDNLNEELRRRKAEAGDEA